MDDGILIDVDDLEEMNEILAHLQTHSTWHCNMIMKVIHNPSPEEAEQVGESMQAVGGDLTRLGEWLGKITKKNRIRN